MPTRERRLREAAAAPLRVRSPASVAKEKARQRRYRERVRLQKQVQALPGAPAPPEEPAGAKPLTLSAVREQLLIALAREAMLCLEHIAYNTAPSGGRTFAEYVAQVLHRDSEKEPACPRPER